MKQDGFPALPTYTPLVTDNEHPFMYVPGPNHNFLNSTFSNNEKHIKLEKTPKLFINTKMLKNTESLMGHLYEFGTAGENAS